MCGRYYIDDEDIAFRKIIHEAVSNKGDMNVKTGEIFPAYKAPVLLNDGKRTRPFIMEWGFPSFYKSGVIINARAETALEKRTFKEPLLSRRCVIPASGFFEWQRNDDSKIKDKYLFTLPKSSILYLAGFYNEFKIDGESVNRFVILTTAANRSMADIHDRMPLIIMEADVANWTSNTDFALRALKATPPNLDKVKV